MKIALAQLNFQVGNFELNTEKILQAIENARSKGAEICVFAELCICGYPALDFLEYQEFIDKINLSIDKIASSCVGIAAVIGAPSINTDEGKPLFNSAYFLADGKVKQIAHKALLPNYDVFDEYRYFEPGKEFNTVEYKGKKIALTVCEDIWTLEQDVLYTLSPMDEYKKQNPDFIINIAASPFSYTHAEKRKNILKANALKYNLPVIYVNHCGSQTELIFDGGSMVLDKRGVITQKLNYFKEDFVVFDTEEMSDVSNIHSDGNGSVSQNKIPLIHDALIFGIREYFSKSGFKKAILGLSGGIDSALVCSLAVKALGKENVKGILLPSEFSSAHSIDDALKLAQNLGIETETIKINSVYEAFVQTLSSSFNGLPFDLTEENIQARCRGVLLMALSNKFKYILLNTSNKSELAVGYGTLYGDMCGGISVLGDVYKTEVYELSEYINRENEIIPRNTIEKAPSAELRPGQKDSDSLPDYKVLDSILFQYIELKSSCEHIIKMGFDEAIVKKVLRLVNMNEYKRFQAPPVLRVSDKAFGMGRRMQLSGKYLV